MEKIGDRIRTLRTRKGWSLARLGEEMAKAIDRKKPFSGEVIRLYEENINQPGADARRALAKVFERTEVYIEFGDAPAARQPGAAYQVSDAALELAREFDALSASGREHVRRTVELAKYSDTSSARRAAARHDVRIKDGALQSGTRRKARKPVR